MWQKKSLQKIFIGQKNSKGSKSNFVFQPWWHSKNFSKSDIFSSWKIFLVIFFLNFILNSRKFLHEKYLQKTYSWIKKIKRIIHSFILSSFCLQKNFSTQIFSVLRTTFIRTSPISPVQKNQSLWRCFAGISVVGFYYRS